MNRALTALVAIGLVAGLSALLMSEAFSRFARRVDERVSRASQPEVAAHPDGGVVAVPPALAGGARDQLAVKALQGFTTYCARCHGGRGDGQAAGGLDCVLDRDALVARKLVVPGKPGDSPLLARLERHSEPPRGEQPRPTDDEIALVRTWIAAGAPVPEVGSGHGRPSAFVSPSEIERAMFDDLEALPPAERARARYFTLAHLYNRGAPAAELQETRGALARLLGHLAATDKTVVPVAIEPTVTVLRVDLDALGWSAQAWNRVASGDPYALGRGTMRERAVQGATGCDVPAVRADWFVTAASRPPLLWELRAARDASADGGVASRDGGVADEALRDAALAAVARRYEAEIDVRAAAAELGLPEAELIERTKREGSKLPLLARLVDGRGALSRDSMVAEFAAAASALGMGTRVVVLPAPPPVPAEPPPVVSAPPPVVAKPVAAPPVAPVHPAATPPLPRLPAPKAVHDGGA